MKTKALDEILAHLHEIEEWSRQGETESAIASRFGIRRSTFYNYKQKNKAIEAAIAAGRRQFVGDLRSTLVKKAKGFQYEEKKVIREGGKTVREEITVKSSLPDVAAINLLLKNYDVDNWANDPQNLELRKQELEFKKEQASKEDW